MVDFVSHKIHTEELCGWITKCHKNNSYFKSVYDFVLEYTHGSSGLYVAYDYKLDTPEDLET